MLDLGLIAIRPHFLMVLGFFYWTSGMYISRKKWIWATKDEEITLNYWAEDEPRNPNSRSRLTLIYENQYDSTWGSDANTLLQKYICEVHCTLPHFFFALSK